MKRKLLIALMCAALVAQASGGALAGTKVSDGVVRSAY